MLLKSVSYDSYAIKFITWLLHKFNHKLNAQVYSPEHQVHI